MRTVSPTGGAMRSVTGCARAADAMRLTTTSATKNRANMAVMRRSEAVRIIRGSGPQRRRWRSRRLLRRHDATKLAREKRFHVVGTRVQRGVARADDFLFRRDRREVLHPA